MTPEEVRARFRAARVARLATVGPGGHPRLVPIVFALDGGRLVSAVDHKPKRTVALRRLDDIAANARVSVLVDSYHEDWSQLWWARADGHATVAPAGSAAQARAVELLCARYPQYRQRRPEGAAVVVEVERWSGRTGG